jgi:hypothetical protein
MKNIKQVLPSLGFCLLMDLAGMLTFILPGLGEFADIVWAPISGFIFYKLFGGRMGLIGGVLNFLEEIIPFTDFIPSFTIAWFIRRNETNSTVVKEI